MHARVISHDPSHFEYLLLHGKTEKKNVREHERPKNKQTGHFPRNFRDLFMLLSVLHYMEFKQFEYQAR